MSAPLPFIEAEVLRNWLLSQRWFASKSREVSALNVLEITPIGDEPEPYVALAIVEVRFQAGTHELYQLPLGFRHVDEHWTEGVIETVGDRTMYDGLVDPACARRIAQALRENLDIEHEEGAWHFTSIDGAVPPDEQLQDVRPMGVEQSNTSIVFADEAVLKAYRRIEPGPNPELEVLRFLTEHGFQNIARLRGFYAHSGRLVDATLGLMQDFLQGGRDGWELALDSFGGDVDGYLSELGDLGRVTAEMHTTLGSDPGDPTFAPEEPSTEAISLILATVDEEIEAIFRDIPDDERVARIAGRGQEVRERLRDLGHVGAGGKVIRTHGDFHLGQVLKTDRGWVVLDFEGEPARTLPQRRQKRSPLRDVAGMLRSFSYAASGGEMLRGTASPEGWEERAREAFLAAYFEAVDRRLLPHGEDNMRRQLMIFELEKAVYELRYELNNRPDWVRIPVAGIARLLEADQ